MVESILVPVDGSETMERTVSFACDIVKMVGGSVTLLHVVALPIPAEQSAYINLTPMEKWGEKILQTAEDIVKGKGCKADRILKTDMQNAGHTIVRVAREGGFTLIIIHARGHSRISTLIPLGSVCHTVAHRSPCPVMIVRP